MNDIYREQLMEHFKSPLNKGTLKNPDVTIVETNPFCGDSITLQLKIIEGKITEAVFDGEACAVSVASSSILTDAIKNKSLSEAKAFSKEELLELLGVELTTSRVKCATLALDALSKALAEYEEKNISEITKDANIAELVSKHPQVAEVLLDYGLHCVGCFANTFDSLEAGARIHGYSDNEIEELVARVNEVIKFGE